MYRTSSSSCSYEDHEYDQAMLTSNSNSNPNPNPNSSMYIPIHHPSNPFIIPSPPSYSSSSSSFLHPSSSYTGAGNNGGSFLHRSNSSHSLPVYHNHHHHHHHHHIGDFVSNPINTSCAVFSTSSPSSSSCLDFMDFNSMPMRRVYSTGDLQGMNGAQVGSESSNQEGNGALPNKIARYSAEERKERIEKYRSKRNQRNFQKKITYACRKTLADSRPRVKGRFARNGELETEVETEPEIFPATNNYGCFKHGAGYSYTTYDANGLHAGGGNHGDLWRQMEQVMEADDVEGITYFYDDELMWSNLSDVLPMTNMMS